MTWTISLAGHDDMSGDQKESFENYLVEEIKSLTQKLVNTEGCNVTSANVTTNTTGTVNALVTEES